VVGWCGAQMRVLRKPICELAPERLRFLLGERSLSCVALRGSKQEVRVLGAKRILALGSVAALCAGAAAPLFIASAANAAPLAHQICLKNTPGRAGIGGFLVRAGR